MRMRKDGRCREVEAIVGGTALSDEALREDGLGEEIDVEPKCVQDDAERGVEELIAKAGVVMFDERSALFVTDLKGIVQGGGGAS